MRFALKACFFFLFFIKTIWALCSLNSACKVIASFLLLLLLLLLLRAGDCTIVAMWVLSPGVVHGQGVHPGVRPVGVQPVGVQPTVFKSVFIQVVYPGCSTCGCSSDFVPPLWVLRPARSMSLELRLEEAGNHRRERGWSSRHICRIII